MIQIFKLSALLILISINLSASTFVGNGGNSSDIEYQIATKQTQEALELIITQSENPKQVLCECNPTFSGHAICEILNSLTVEQKNYCQKFLQNNAQAMRTALMRTQITWTNEDITVKESNSLRSADAVTDANSNRITISQPKFIAMKSYERIFILCHELGHMIKLDSNYINDEQKIGPFETSDGGRQLLNAIGAAVAMDAYDNEVLDKYSSSLTRSRASSSHFLSLYSQGSALRSSDTYAVEKTGGTGFRYQCYYQGGNFGLFAGGSYSKGDRSILTQTQLEQKRSDLHAGVSWRFLSNADPLTFLGQSYGNFNLGYESSQHTYKAEDSFIASESKTNSSQGFVEFAYHLPLMHGLWIEAMVGIRADNYKIEIPNRTIEYNATTYSGLGVSYGF